MAGKTGFVLCLVCLSAKYVPDLPAWAEHMKSPKNFSVHIVCFNLKSRCCGSLQCEFSFLSSDNWPSAHIITGTLRSGRDLLCGVYTCVHLYSTCQHHRPLCSHIWHFLHCYTWDCKRCGKGFATEKNYQESALASGFVQKWPLVELRAFLPPWKKWYHDMTSSCLKSMVRGWTNQWKGGWKRNTKNLWLFRRGQTRL